MLAIANNEQFVFDESRKRRHADSQEVQRRDSVRGRVHDGCGSLAFAIRTKADPVVTRLLADLDFSTVDHNTHRLDLIGTKRDATNGYRPMVQLHARQLSFFPAIAFPFVDSRNFARIGNVLKMPVRGLYREGGLIRAQVVRRLCKWG